VATRVKAIEQRRKKHEARRADRPFAVGDTLRLREWEPAAPGDCNWRASGLAGRYTGHSLLVKVTHLTRGEYGLPPDLAIMSIEVLLESFHTMDAT